MRLKCKKTVMRLSAWILLLALSLGGVQVQAAKKAAYTKKKLALYGTYEGVFYSIEPKRLHYNKEYKLYVMEQYEKEDDKYVPGIFSWSDSSKFKKIELRTEKFTTDIARIGSDGNIYVPYSKEKKRDEEIYFKMIDKKRKVVADTKLDSISYAEPDPVYMLDHERPLHSFYIVDYGVEGDYVDMILAERYDDRTEKHTYSIQRFNWKTGERVYSYKLPFKFEELYKDYIYGTDGKAFYKYTKDGKECLWSSALLSGKASLKNKYNNESVQAYCVRNGKLFYTNRNGVFMLNIEKNNSKPKRLISLKDWRWLKTGKERENSVRDLQVVNKNHFYLLCCDADSDVLYQFKKK